MKKGIIFVLVVAALGAAVYAFRTTVPQSGEEVSLAPFEELSVQSGSLIAHPLVVTGKVPGPWFFEASFPVSLLDANGEQLARVPAQAEGEWMTEGLVPFSVTIAYTEPATETGTLILEKDNPSGLPENAQEVRIPLRFR